MKRIIMVMTAIALTATFVYAENTAQTTSVANQAVKPVEVNNKICPVSGDKIVAPGEKSAMGETVKYEYNGKIYNLCCTMCVKDFKKNPEKYSKIAEDEMKTKK